jgi:hypothetical protein
VAQAEPEPEPEPAEVVQAEPEPEPEPEPAEVAETDPLLQELTARSPQKQLFLPPREDEKFAYQESVEPPAETGEVAVTQEPEPSEPPVETFEPEEEVATIETLVPEEVAAAEAVQPEEVAVVEQPQIESVEMAAAPEPVSGGETELAEAQAPPELTPELLDRIASGAHPAEKPPTLAIPEPLPAEQKPAAQVAAQVAAIEEAPSIAALPVETPQPKPEAKPEPAPEKISEKPAEKVAAAVTVTPPEPKPGPAVPIAKAPPAASKTAPYYVQLAAYSAESLASGLAASLSATYPVLVLAPAQAGRQIYRVLIGPLNKAESGTVLNWFRYRGFPDAFVKRE